MRTTSWSRRSFEIANYALLTVLAALCFLPIVHVLSLSLSSRVEVEAGSVLFWPRQFTWASYEYVASQGQFFRSMGITLERVTLGTVLNLALTLLCAYPLAKEAREFRLRTVYVWYFVFTILFGGGLIPWYLTIKNLGLLNSIWALVLPGAVPVFNIILLLNFFRRLPKELSESARIDGAGDWRILLNLFIPLSTPALATITLFTVVGHWNAWFDGLLLMNNPHRYPLSSYLQTVITMPDLSKFTDPETARLYNRISDRTTRAAQVFVGMLPILLAYPFLQRYFIHGIVLGSVKE
ncbi:carbohydrate ABC transporter permease [Cohnella sp. CBP 2801]|uniref:Carbohydrate ABC transporter permease n=2 Tax=Cohnella zeiphila TaxID=2761120 RepID=A0A7X0SR27_9BACL|nr:carbohydrate ABC transporter permease [Cohnella zeiphila]MBB6734381.1 carbohydrate ABC transporter permease [Cohnella zeiphila]